MSAMVGGDMLVCRGRFGELGKSGVVDKSRLAEGGFVSAQKTQARALVLK